MIYRIIEISEVSEAKLKETFDNMNENRKERCLRYKFDEDKKRMITGEYLAISLAKELFGVLDEDISLINLENGQPVILIKGKKLFCSISHSGSFAAAAVDEAPVGIDIEEIRDVPEGVVRKAFSAEEAGFVNSAETEEEKKQRFLRIWTAKEAYLKLKGTGLKGLEEAYVLPYVMGEKRENLKFQVWICEDSVCSLFTYQK